MLFFHVGLATQIVMVVLFLLPLLAAARWRTALNFGVTYAVLTALGMLDPDALGLPWLHVVSALAVGVTMMLPCFITDSHGSTAWPTGTWYSTADISCRITRPMNSCPSPPGCVAAMGLRAFDLEPYRHRIAALASSPAAESGSTDNASLAIEWFAEDDTSLDTYEYAIDHVIEHGLESSPTFVLRTADPAAEDSPFRWLLAINPLPSRKAFAEGGLLSHLHFQYANDLRTLVATDEATGAETLRNPRWYAHHVRQRGNHRGPLRHHPCVAPLAVDLATYGGMTAPR